jgi:hypothetical protein
LRNKDQYCSHERNPIKSVLVGTISLFIGAQGAFNQSVVQNQQLHQKNCVLNTKKHEQALPSVSPSAGRRYDIRLVHRHLSTLFSATSLAP